MKVTIEYDHLQQKIMGDKETLELEEGTSLADLFKELDKRIEIGAKEQGPCPECIKLLKADGINACMVQVNSRNPKNHLEHAPQDGDNISTLIGFCGG